MADCFSPFFSRRVFKHFKPRWRWKKMIREITGCAVCRVEQWLCVGSSGLEPAYLLQSNSLQCVRACLPLPCFCQCNFWKLKEYFHYDCAALHCAAIVNDSAALRVAIDIETLSAFLYLSQRAAQAAVVETGLNISQLIYTKVVSMTRLRCSGIREVESLMIPLLQIYCWACEMSDDKFQQENRAVARIPRNTAAFFSVKVRR